MIYLVIILWLMIGTRIVLDIFNNEEIAEMVPFASPWLVLFIIIILLIIAPFIEIHDIYIELKYGDEIDNGNDDDDDDADFNGFDDI